MAATLRQRNTFVSDITDTDDEDGPARILNEQEQAILEQLTKEDARLHLYASAGSIIIGLSAWAQWFVIFGAIGSSKVPQRVLALLYLVLHTHSVWLLERRRFFSVTDNAATSVPSFLPTQLATLIGPLLAFFYPQDIQVLYIVIPLVATVIAWICYRIAEDGAKRVTEFEMLLHDAKSS